MLYILFIGKERVLSLETFNTVRRIRRRTALAGVCSWMVRIADAASKVFMMDMHGKPIHLPSFTSLLISESLLCRDDDGEIVANAIMKP
jgi:hypothetical protein